ncbi:hypothetical protein ACFFQF_23005 [Haladaptatus pallidirubidus]|uniref:hypothetical protein n=1 Tax=Haladaptatus pallidirubidus TaxID=1008152 RepID=UPI001D11AD04|nr:hypothetical protein [Haladaptatus pallidirubidus]
MTDTTSNSTDQRTLTESADATTEVLLRHRQPSSIEHNSMQRTALLDRRGG